MKKLFPSSILFGVFLFTSALFADTPGGIRDFDDQDIQALRDWINAKRQVTLKELGGDLSLSGQVRTEFQTTWEKRNGVEQLGSSSPTGLPAQGYDVEFDLFLDYRTERTWASIKLKFDNDAGIFFGTTNGINLERAYFGTRVVDSDLYSMDFEVGRRRMTTVFDSKIEFGSFFDGILFKYDHALENIADIYAHIGTFVINERKNHYGYVGELGMLNIAHTGMYAKYSLIDWDTKHYPEAFVNHRFDFLVSQLILGYRFIPQKLDKLVLLYLAGLYNHKAKRLAISDHKLANWGGYVGFSIGELKKQWDFAVDVNYQFVSAQAIPDFNTSGINIGNANKSGFYTKTLDNTVIGGGAGTVAGGTTNYRGFIVTLDILLTDKLDLQQIYQQSITLDTDIGPFRTYKQYEMEFIYSW